MPPHHPKGPKRTAVAGSLFGDDPPPRPPPTAPPGAVDELARLTGVDRRTVALWEARKVFGMLGRLRAEGRRPLALREAPAPWEVAPDALGTARDPTPLPVLDADASFATSLAADPPECVDELRRCVTAAVRDLGYWQLWQVMVLCEGLYADRAAVARSGRGREAGGSAGRWGDETGSEQPPEEGGGDEYVEYE